MISVRLVERNDLPRLQALAIKVYYETFAESNTPDNMDNYISTSLSMAQLEKEFDEAGTVFYLAVEEETFAGYAKLRLNDEMNHLIGPNTIEMQRLYVDIPFQSRKVGALLMQTCMDYAVAHRFDWMWLGVWEKNFVAQKFYTKWGFEKFSEHIFQMGDDPQTDWLMRKWLQ